MRRKTASPAFKCFVSPIYRSLINHRSLSEGYDMVLRQMTTDLAILFVRPESVSETTTTPADTPTSPPPSRSLATSPQTSVRTTSAR